MLEIINAINRLTSSYDLLSENTNKIFNTLKIKDYEEKEVLEKESEILYNEKNVVEQELIRLVKDKASSLNLKNQKITDILEVHSEPQEVMQVQFELEKMLESINMYQFNLKRNIEFAKAVMDIKTKELEFMFEVIQREGLEQKGPLLLNEEV